MQTMNLGGSMMTKRPIGFTFQGKKEDSIHDDRSPEHGDNPVIEPNPVKQDQERDEEPKEKELGQSDNDGEKSINSAAMSVKTNMVLQHIYAQPKGKVVGKLQPGEVEIKESHNGWSKISSGWIQDKFLK